MRLSEDEILGDIARFWSKVDKTPGLGPKGDCWEWKGYIVNYEKGHGQFWCNGKTVWAHRYSYELEHGPISEKYDTDLPTLVLHSCDWARCVRPIHLTLGTQKQNRQQAMDRLRIPRGRNHPSWKHGRYSKDVIKRI